MWTQGSRCRFAFPGAPNPRICSILRFGKQISSNFPGTFPEFSSRTLGQTLKTATPFSSHEFSYEKCSEIFPEIFEPLFCGSEKIPGKFPPNFPLNFPNFPAKIKKKLHRRASAGAQGEPMFRQKNEHKDSLFGPRGCRVGWGSKKFVRFPSSKVCFALGFEGGRLGCPGMSWTPEVCYKRAQRAPGSEKFNHERQC